MRNPPIRSEPESDEFRFGLKQRLYNWTMRHAREVRGWTQLDLGTICGMPMHSVGQIETLRRFPNKWQAERIASALGRTVDALFPEWLKEFRLQAVPRSAEEESISLEEALERRLITPVALLEQGWEDEIEMLIGMQEVIPSLLAKLPPRERKVIELRFGFDKEEDKEGDRCSRPRTLEEVAREFGVTRERIRQVENRAFRSMRRTTECQRLKEVLIPEREPSKPEEPSKTMWEILVEGGSIMEYLRERGCIK